MYGSVHKYRQRFFNLQAPEGFCLIFVGEMIHNALLASYITTIILVASAAADHRSVLYSASPPRLLSKREEAGLYIFNQLYNYHINFSSLLITFG